MSIGRSNLEDSRVRGRMLSQITIMFAVLFGLLFFRFAYLQIIQGEYHSRLSLENMMRLRVDPAPRGRIFDRYGRLLVRNRPSYSIAMYPYKIKERAKLFDRLAEIRSINGEAVFNQKELEQIYQRARFRRFDPAVLKEDVDFDLATVIEEYTLDLPGVGIEKEIRREYPFGTLGSHLFGYISQIPEDHYDSLKTFGYMRTDLIGKSGSEKEYEELFRGRNGQEYIEVNAFGKQLGVLADMPGTKPQRGHDLFLTIDYDLQLAAEQAFPDTVKGAVVVMDPRNGEILAMLSSPRPDPNLFTFASKKRGKLWAQVALDPRMPLNNRAVQGTYPPGSTFKMVTAVAGLEEGLIKPEEKFRTPCHGSFRFGRRVYRCWKPEGHGALGMIQGLMHSCDVYFYQLGLRTSDSGINKWARHLGFDAPTGIDYPIEKRGMLLGEESFNRRFRDRGWIWTKGMILNLAIGQGQIVTPLQLVNYISALCNGQVLYWPHMLREVHYSDNRKPRSIGKREIGRVPMRPATVEIMKQALYGTVNLPGGTGGASRVKGVPVGGKTGSAENPQGDLTHALFVGIAPVDSPTIAICVVAENVGHGGSIAAPIAGKIFNEYFRKFPYQRPDSLKTRGAF